jgi:hypothetical protein
MKIVHKMAKGEYRNGMFYPMTYCGEDAIELSFRNDNVSYSVAAFNCSDCEEAYALDALAELP